MEKKHIRNSRLKDIILDILVIVIAFYMLRKAEKVASLCKTPLLTWMKVETVFYFLSIVKNIVIIFVAYNSSQLKRHKRIVEVFYTMIVVNFEIGWLIYGNTFHYSD